MTGRAIVAAFRRDLARLCVAGLVLSGLVLAWLGGAATPVRAGNDLAVETSLEPAVVGLDELALFSIEVRGSGLSSVSFEPDFELDNFEIAGGPSRSDNFSFVNGATSRSVRFSWQLRPLAVGKARVHAIQVKLGNETRALPDREVAIEKQAPPGREAADAGEPLDPFERMFGDPFGDPLGRRAAAPSRPAARPKVFVRAETTPEHPVVGQQVLYTLYLYTQGDIHAVNPRSLPSFRGFWVKDVPQPERLRPEWTEEKDGRYGRVVLLQRALFPLAPGRHEIEPIAVDLVVRVAELSPFGGVFGRAEEMHTRSDGVTIDVAPLPPAPPGFAGAVGDLELAAHLEPPRVDVGQAATLHLELSGHGHLQGLPEPAIVAPAGVRLFAPQSQSEETWTGGKLRARRTWSYVLVPDHAGSFALPAVSVPFFDPQSGAYRTASSSPVSLAVSGPVAVASTATPSGASPGGEPPAHTAPDAGTGSLRRALAWAAWALALPVVALLVVAAWRRRPGHDTPTRQAAHQLRERLTAAAGESRPRQTAAEVEEAWREFLAARWQVPPGTPSSQWSELLVARGADRASADSLVALADDLHYLRYAPELSSVDSLRAEVLARSTRLGRALR